MQPKSAVHVGDEFEFRMSVIAAPDGAGGASFRVVGPNGLINEIPTWMTGRELAAGRLVATRPLAVGDSVRGKASGTRGSLLAIDDTLAWVRWDDRNLPLTEYLRYLERCE